MLKIDRNNQIIYEKGDVRYHGLIGRCKSGLQYVLMYPENMQDDKELIVESLNYNPDNKDVKDIKDITDEVVQQAVIPPVTDMMDWMQDASVLMPIVPHDKSYSPYYQQLSRECFSSELAGKREVDRIDLQYLDCIEDAKEKLRAITQKRVPDKVFLHGYSSSGVFAQRFQ